MKKSLLLFFLFYGCCYAMAQIAVQGRVVSATDGLPLAGVNVVVKGTTQGTATDADGKYIISASENDVLVFSFIGFSPMEISVGDPRTANIKLNEDIATLSEVTIVSTGYQQLPKERATGSFVQVDNALINRRVSTDVLSRLEDVTSGLIFNRNVEGKTNDISIRGTSTIFSNTQPLIVIDNFPYDGDINTINPNDVESITVLKDAAAASIWGARAGNGVIVITTKKGKQNQPLKASFNSNITIAEKPDLFYAPQMSSGDFIDVEKMLFDKGYYASTEISNGHAPITPAVELMIAERDGLLTSDDAQSQLNVLRKQDVRNDFEHYFYRKSVKQQYALNLNGGNGANRYFISAGWDKNLDNLIGNQYDRVTFNANNTWSAMKEKLEFSAGIYYTESEKQNNNPGSSSISFGGTTPMYPYASLKDAEGNNLSVIKDYRLGFLQQAEDNGLLNWQYKPLDEIHNRNNRTRLTDYRINTRLNYQIIKGLNAEVLYQYWRGISEQRDLRDESTYYTRNLINQLTQDDGSGNLIRPIPIGGILDLTNQSSASHNLRTQVTYAKQWSKHDVSALAGYEVKEVNTIGSSLRYYGYDDNLATNQVVDYVNFFSRYDNPGSYSQIPSGDGQWSLTDRFISYFANGAYTYNHRYTLSGSIRKDQSNLFGVNANQRGVPLWSTGVAWNISEENFYNYSAFPYLKLRATYGYNGNINKSVTAFTTAYRVGYDNLTGLPYANIINPPNSDLRWEQVKVINLGLDFQLKDQVLSGSIEYYNKQGIDLIGTTPFAPSSGVTSFTGNTANTKGNGIDLTLNSINIDKAIKWNTNFLFSYITEKVSKYKLKSDASSYMLYGSGAAEMAYPLEGKPLYAIYSYSWAGLDPETGDPRSYLDGAPSKDYATIVSNATPESIVYHGSARPTVFGALRNTVTWKNISLSFNISYRLGYYFRRNSVRYSNVLTGQVDHGDYANRWTKAGDEIKTNVPSLPALSNINRDNIYLYSEALVEKGDHIRFQDINLSYTFDRQSIAKLPFERAQFYIYANNLGILWKATDVNIDPDYPTMKPIRSVAFGIKLDF